jgi:hypothetical protein
MARIIPGEKQIAFIFRGGIWGFGPEKTELGPGIVPHGLAGGNLLHGSEVP